MEFRYLGGLQERAMENLDSLIGKKEEKIHRSMRFLEESVNSIQKKTDEIKSVMKDAPLASKEVILKTWSIINCIERAEFIAKIYEKNLNFKNELLKRTLSLKPNDAINISLCWTMLPVVEREALNRAWQAETS